MFFMIILGIVLLVLALIIPALHFLFWIGIALIIIGLVLLLLGTARTGGRRWY
jgi:membrane protein implicated in regulation of membrane protease activity